MDNYSAVLAILVIMLVGSVVALFVMPPLLNKIDKDGKVGIGGF